jgi:hypothetical protein
MSKNELQKILDNQLAISYKDKVRQIEDYLVSVARWGKYCRWYWKRIDISFNVGVQAFFR